MADKLRAFVVDQVLPAVPVGSRFRTEAYWISRCRDVGISFEEADDRIQQFRSWLASDHMHGDPERIAKKINGVRKELREKCDAIIAEAKANHGAPTVKPRRGPPGSVY